MSFGKPVNPPEPQCPRCRKICWPDALVEGKCPHCGFDGSKDDCVGCGKPISPSSANYGYSLCESCEEKGHRRDYEDGRYDAAEQERAEDLEQAVVSECYAIEQGAKSEQDMDDILSGGDAS